MLVFGNIFSFPGVNWAQNGPKPSFLDMPFSYKGLPLVEI